MDKHEKMKITEALYKQGKTVNEIAEYLHCCQGTISNYIGDLGLRKKRAKILPQQIMKLYIDGLSSSEIAYKLECSRTTVLDALRANGCGRKRIEVEDELIDDNTIYAIDPNDRPLEKIIVHGKWQEKDGVKYRIKYHYTDITPLFAPR